MEHDPQEIYNSQHAVMLEAISKSGLQASEIAAIGITNQRETTILWDRETGEPVYNAIVWQCRRTSGMIDELKSRGFTDYIKQATGLLPDAYFSATKIKWILDNVPGSRERAKRGKLLFGTVDTWLLWNLTGGQVHATDYTNASRTMLYDIHNLKWDEKLLTELDIPLEILPEVFPSSHLFGYTTIDGKQIPIAGIAGDQQAALFGQGCFDAGEAKNTYGTGCFMLMNTGTTPIQSQNGLLTTIAAVADDKIHYALEGSVFVGGAVIQWLRDELRILSDSFDAEYFAQKVEDTGGVYLVPAFTGIGAPYWDMYARGCLIGVTRGTKREHIIRAAEESIAYQIVDLVDAMERDTGIALSELRADGGATRDAFLLQFQADILNKAIRRPKIKETTALGAALLAGLAVGVWKDLGEVRMQLGSSFVQFMPQMDEKIRETKLEGWHKAVNRSLSWAN